MPQKIPYIEFKYVYVDIDHVHDIKVFIVHSYFKILILKLS